MSKSIPPLLQPYLALPSESSLILLTSVLGASPNWLILRYIHSLLLPSPSTSTSSTESEGPVEPKILFVSFLRDLNFWRENGRKIVCLSLSIYFSNTLFNHSLFLSNFLFHKRLSRKHHKNTTRISLTTPRVSISTNSTKHPVCTSSTV
jgi:hypothetical protein